MICTICDGTGVYSVPTKPCFRCKGTLVVAEGWLEPDKPDINLIREIARDSGYAVAVHGSEKRDYDVMAIAWTQEALPIIDFVINLCKGLDARVIDSSTKPHGRQSFAIQLINKACLMIDLSVVGPIDKEITK